MKKEERALIRAVARRPDDDEPRLAYADWLDAHGQPARAEFVRVQCSISELQGREQALLAQHGEEWSRELRGLYVDACHFRRGFPEDLRIRANKYLLGHRDIHALTPVRSLGLTLVSDDRLAGLADVRGLSKLTSLSLDHPPGKLTFGPAGVQALAASKHLGNLTHLAIKSDSFDAAALEVLTDAPGFEHLTHLSLQGRDRILGWNSPAYNRLSCSPHLPNLEQVRVGDYVMEKAQLDVRRSRGREPGPPGRGR